MNPRLEIENLFVEHGYTDFKWIDPRKIVVSQWVRMKCMFGCNEYGKNACCPPNVPSVPECEKFFHEYQDIAVFHFEKAVEKPEDRHEWTSEINSELLKLERAVFVSGYPKTFLLFMDSCCLCKHCTESRNQCKNPKSARPTPEGLAMDVFSTVRQVGYPIDVLSDYTQTMNRYAFLLIR
jgi:predicted metal-binding protein